MIDKIFKMGLLVIGILFLFLYYQSSLNSRYHFTKDNTTVFGKIFDSKTGRCYTFLNRTGDEPIAWVVYDSVRGTIKITKASFDNSGLFQTSIVQEEDLPDSLRKNNPPKDILEK